MGKNLFWVCCNNVALHVMFIVQIFMSTTFFLSFSCWLLLMTSMFFLQPVSMLTSSLQYIVKDTMSLLLRFHAYHLFWVTHDNLEFTSIVVLYKTCLFQIYLNKVFSRHKLKRLMICVQKVCHNWNTRVLDSTVWTPVLKSIYFKEDHIFKKKHMRGSIV